MTIVLVAIAAFCLGLLIGVYVGAGRTEKNHPSDERYRR